VKRARALESVASSAFSPGRPTVSAMSVLSGRGVEIARGEGSGGAVRAVESAAGRPALRAGDRDLALDLLLGAALRCWRAGTCPSTRWRVAETLGEVTGAAADPRYIAALALTDPALQRGVVLDLISRFAPEDIIDGDVLRLLGMAAHAIGDRQASLDFLSRAESVLQDQGRLGRLSQLLIMQVIDSLECGQWNRAAAAGREGRWLVAETGHPVWPAGLHACAAMDRALRGDVRQASAHATEVEFLASGPPLGGLLSRAQLARGVALVTTGQHAAAYTQLRRLFEPSDPSFHPRERFGGIMFLADAAAEAGKRDDARDVLRGLEVVGAVPLSPVLHDHLRYAHAVLADPLTAPGAYSALMSADYASSTWARARAELAYGSWLWRERSAAEALVALRSAETAFDRIGAANWAVKARRESSRATARNLPEAVTAVAGCSQPTEAGPTRRT
jgi:hypothetical protein